MRIIVEIKQGYNTIVSEFTTLEGACVFANIVLENCDAEVTIKKYEEDKNND